MQKCGVEFRMLLAYSPSSHAVERENLCFSKLCNIFMTAYKQPNWVSLLPSILEALHSIERSYTIADSSGQLSTIKCSAHEFLYGTPSPTSFEKLLPELFSTGFIPKQVLKYRNEIHKAVRKAELLERLEFERNEKQLKLAKKSLQIGDYVLLRRNPRIKYATQYYRDVYKVVGVNGRKITITSVFKGKPASFAVHIRFLKKLSFHNDLFKHVPESLMGHLDPIPPPPSTLTLRSHRTQLPRALKSHFSFHPPKPRKVTLRPRGRPPATASPPQNALTSMYDSSCDTSFPSLQPTILPQQQQHYSPHTRHSMGDIHSETPETSSIAGTLGTDPDDTMVAPASSTRSTAHDSDEAAAASAPSGGRTIRDATRSIWHSIKGLLSPRAPLPGTPVERPSRAPAPSSAPSRVVFQTNDPDPLEPDVAGQAPTTPAVEQPRRGHRRRNVPRRLIEEY